MKNTSNALRRVMSVVLVFAMMFTSMPTGALAEDVVDPVPSTTAAEPAASETTEPTTPEPASSEAVPAANSAVLPANDGDPAPVTFTVTFVANGETLVTQTIQQGGSAVAPDAPLVSGQRFVRWDTDFTNVQSDLTVTAVYEAITAKNMTVEYRYSDGTQAAPSHVEQAVVGEPFHKTVPSPALDGFTPDKAEVVFAVESVTEDLTVVVTYSGAARNYTVKHLFQNVEGTAYAEDEALRETERLLKEARSVELLGEALGEWDSGVLVVTTRLVTLAKEHNIPLDDARLPEGIRNLTKLALAVPPNTAAQRKAQKTTFLERVGGFALAVPRMAHDIFDFIGELVLSAGRLFRGRSSCTSGNVWLAVQESGVDALPIVSLISLLVGLILAFVGVIQLKMFGAEIYVSSLVAVSMTRIMGAIMTGIIGPHRRLLCRRHRDHAGQ